MSWGPTEPNRRPPSAARAVIGITAPASNVACVSRRAPVLGVAQVTATRIGAAWTSIPVGGDDGPALGNR